MMKRWYRKGMVGLVIVMLAGMLSGCTLAKEGAGEAQNAQKDRLVGVFLTTEYLDLFDMEAYLEDNIDKFVNGGNVTVENTSKYNERLYGTIDKHGYTEAKDCEHWEIRFGELEGIAFFHAEWQEEGQEPFGMLMMGDEVCNVTEHLNVTDDGESIKLIGTIYALANENVESVGFYANPVYMTEEGEYYLVSGWGHFQSGVIGGSYTLTLDEEIVNTENGEKEVYGGGVELTVDLSHSEPKQISLHYLDKELSVIQSEEFVAGSLPSELHPTKGTSCIIAETEWADGSITRELVEPTQMESTLLETFYKMNEMVLGKIDTEIIWK